MPRRQLSSYVCEGCSKAFDTSQMKYYHKKKHCTGEKGAIGQLEELQIRYDELQKQFEKCQRNTNVVTNNFNINFLDTSHIDLNSMLARKDDRIDWGQIHSNVVKAIYFNPDCKKNMCVRVADTDSEKGYGFIYIKKFNSWVYNEIRALAGYIEENATLFMFECIEEKKVSISAKETDEFYRFRNSYGKCERSFLNILKILTECKPVNDKLCPLKSDHYIKGTYVKVLNLVKV
jgi:hypothetical protein